MTESLVFEFQPLAAETVRASQLIQRRARLGWMRWAVWPLLLGLALMYRANGVAWSQMGFLWFAMLVLATLSIVGPLLWRRQLKRAYAESPILREPQRYEFARDALTIRGGPAATRLTWDAFQEAVETDDFFLLFFARKGAYYLPKHVVPGERLDALRSLLHAALGTRARGVRPASLEAPPI